MDYTVRHIHNFLYLENKVREDKAARKKKIIIITWLTGPHYSLQQLFVFEKSHDELLKEGGEAQSIQTACHIRQT